MACYSIDTPQTVPSEAAYLHTDRTVYIAGESVFYKLYVLDTTTKKRSDISKVGYVLLRGANLNAVLKIRVKIDEGVSSGSIQLPDSLTSGLYQLVAFTSSMKNYGEQHFYHKEIVIANRFDKELNFKLMNSNSIAIDKTKRANEGPKLETDKAVYGPREKVIVSLDKLNSKANVSVSVFEEPQLSLSDKSLVETLNELQGTQPDSQIQNYYSPEISGKILRGRVVDATTQQRIKNATVLLSCVDSLPNLQYASTNATGVFQMLLNDYYNGRELFFTIKDMPANQHWKIEIEDEFTLSDKWNPSINAANDNFKAFVIKSQGIVYINNAYQLNTNQIPKTIFDVKSSCPQFYRCPVSTILPSDFVPLNDLHEISVELIPFLRISKENGKYNAQVLFQPENLFYNKPAIFLDGVFVDDINKVIGLGSEQIKRIDIVDAERVFGDLIFEGVLSITSKSNEILNTKPASYSLRIKNDNLNIGGSFVAVNPNLNKDKNTPYFKQLLYWNPDLELSETGKTNFGFYTSDNTANFIIKVEGISEDGTPVSAGSTIQVINQINAPEK